MIKLHCETATYRNSNLPNTTNMIRFGFIGAGQISFPSAKKINAHPQARVVAAYDTNPARLKALCDANEIERAYATKEALFADPEIDAVYIAVPNAFHAPLSIEALRAGKHVILDKPFALTVEEAEEVMKVIKETGKTFVLGMNRRFDPDSQKIRSLAAEGVFGDIYHAKASWLRREGIPRLGTWFGNRQLAGAGCLFDIGVHMLDLCLYVIDNFDPISVSGSTYSQFGHRGLGEGGWGLSDTSAINFDVDDFAAALIKFRNGASVALDVAWACHFENDNHLGVQVFGTEAGASTHPARIFRRNPIRENYEIIDDVRATVRFPHADRFSNFINHLLGEEELCVTVDQAFAVQKILCAISESCATGREVRLD